MTPVATAPESRTADVTLRDGRALRLRPPTRSDRDALTTFLVALSSESMSLRFHATLRPRAGLIKPYLAPDWNDRGALIGVLGACGSEQVVALASYDRLRDPAAAEVAFAVADEFQGIGVGSLLLEQTAERAAEAGIERLVFEILPYNSRMLAVVAAAGFAFEQRAFGGVVEVTMHLGRRRRRGDYADSRRAPPDDGRPRASSMHDGMRARSAAGGWAARYCVGDCP